jgi:hypothetical protein
MERVSSEVFLEVFRTLSVDELFHVAVGFQEMLEVRHRIYLSHDRFPW